MDGSLAADENPAAPVNIELEIEMSMHYVTTDSGGTKSCFECGTRWPCEEAVKAAFPGDEVRQKRFAASAARFYDIRALGRSFIGEPASGRSYAADGTVAYTHTDTRQVTFHDGTYILIASRRAHQASATDPAIGVARVISPL